MIQYNYTFGIVTSKCPVVCDLFAVLLSGDTVFSSNVNCNIYTMLYSNC